MSTLKSISVNPNSVDPKVTYRVVVCKKEEILDSITQDQLPEELIKQLEEIGEKFKSFGFAMKNKFFKATVKDRFVLLPQVYTGAEILSFDEKLKADKQALSALRNIPNIPQPVLETMLNELRKNPLYGDVYIVPTTYEKEIYRFVGSASADKPKVNNSGSSYSKLADWLVGELNLRDFVPWDELVNKSRSMGIATLATDDDLQNPSRLSNFKTALKRESGLRLKFRDGIVTKE